MAKRDPRKGLPTRFVIQIGPHRAKYRVQCTIQRANWVCPDGRDCFAMTRYAPKDIWVFRFKEALAQLKVLAHEVGHAVVYEYGLERQLGKLEEPLMAEVIEKLMLSLWGLGRRWPQWELIAMESED